MPQQVLAYTRMDANRRNTHLLLVLFSVVLLPVGVAIGLSVLPIVTMGLGLFVLALIDLGGPLVGGPSVAIFYLLPLIAVVGGAISVVKSLTVRFGSRMILRTARARPLMPGEEPELVRTVENLCIGAGLPLPSIHLIESPAPNTFATGPDPERASLAVTRGLLKLLNQRELEGVIAHELSHIGNHDIRLTTTLAALVSIAILPFSTGAAIRMAMFEGESRFTSESVTLMLAM